MRLIVSANCVCQLRWGPSQNDRRSPGARGSPGKQDDSHQVLDKELGSSGTCRPEQARLLRDVRRGDTPGDPMKRMSRPFVALAALLAVVMPLEQAHCAWMGLENRASAVTCNAPSKHDCCAPTAPSQSQPTKAPANCPCLQLPPASLPAGITSAQVFPTATSAVALTAAVAINPIALIEEPAPALDVGGPPLPVDLGAHGLRAPPLSA